MRSYRFHAMMLFGVVLLLSACSSGGSDDQAAGDQSQDDDSTSEDDDTATAEDDDSIMDDADEAVFTTKSVHQIRFALTDAAYAAINQSDRPEVHAAMAIDGESFPDVGLKLKGCSSYDTLAGKPAFTVDINEWVKGTRYHGLKAFKLNNGTIWDPTRTHEWMAYEFARAGGLMAPRVGWAEVYCNDADLGIYMLVEKHDDAMIAHHDPAQKGIGVVLNPEDGFVDFGIGTLAPNGEANILAAWEEGPLPPDPSVIDAVLATDALIAADPTETAAAELWEHVNRIAFLDYMAWEALSKHVDGYLNSRNWRLFIDGATYSMEWLPSGADNTWHVDRDVFASNSEGENGRAYFWCMNLPSCRRSYAERVLVMAEKMEALDLPTRFQEITAWLDPFIEADPRSPFTSGEIDKARSKTAEILSSGPSEARNQVYAEYPDLEP